MKFRDLKVRVRNLRQALPAPNASSQPDEIQDAITVIKNFIDNTARTPCHSCERKFEPNLDVKATVAQIRGLGRKPAICIRECSHCMATTCLGCGRNYVTNSQRVTDHSIDWCCDDGRIFTIWIVLCRLDLLYLDIELEQAPRIPKSLVKALTPSLGAATSNGTGYGAKGSESDWALNGIVLQNPSVRLKEDNISIDQTVAWLIDLLVSLLPSDEGEDVPVVLTYMLELSLIMDKSAELLRNDCLESIMQRSAVFRSTLNLVEKLGAKSGLSQLVQAGRYSKSQSLGLQAISLANKANTRSAAKRTSLTMADRKHGKGQSVVKGFENLALQSTVVLQAPDAEFSLRSMCQRISDVYNVLARCQSHDRTTIITPEEKWAQFHRANALSFSDDILLDFDSKLQTAADTIARNLQNARTDGARNKRILTECASMRTSLDDGIFVIVAESRPDMMKALIIGPHDTAYTHGLFEYVLHRHPYMTSSCTDKISTKLGSTFSSQKTILDRLPKCISVTPQAHNPLK